MRFLASLFLSCVLMMVGVACARSDGPNPSIQTVKVAALPIEARETLALIERGGPFPYRRDGVVFQNREGRLPKRERAYYHEYTVPTPGAYDRGARRVVTGSVGEYYYSDDHYRSFKRILP